MSSSTSLHTLLTTLRTTLPSWLLSWLLSWLPLIALLLRIAIIVYQHASLMERTEVLETTMGVDTVFSVTPEVFNLVDVGGEKEKGSGVVDGEGNGVKKRWTGKDGAEGQQRYGVEGVCPYY
ncbi:hypothetical protein EX30DRAFT_393676 [Ascodesmis nigricans]|uniref:Uncharacterized protein n=1 Tax=Ascodesmis nigricans TaxID=341454 RepID=A0A4S2N4W9_9PEZI|nr:hypothetical protein EX30DRAFT_393676 [Ascodesmis nigricans]